MSSFDKFLTKVFGSSNQRFLKSIMPMVEKINSLEPSMQALSDDELRAKTAHFKERVQRAVGNPTDKEERKKLERAVLSGRSPTVREGRTQSPGTENLKDALPDGRASDTA